MPAAADKRSGIAVRNFDTRQVERLMKELGPRRGRARTAMVQGINEAAKQVQTVARAEVKQTLNLPARRVNKAVQLRPKDKARKTQRRPTASVSADDDYISLTSYGARVYGGKRRKNQRVEVQIFKSQSRKVLKGAFIRSSRGNRTSGDASRQVFKRKGKARTPIKRMFGPRVGYAFYKKSTINAMDRKANAVVPQVIARRLQFELDKAEKAAKRGIAK